MKRLITFLIGLFISGVALAQQSQGTSFTLDQCIQFALENSISAKNAELDQRIAKARVKETVGIGLPQVSGSASLVHNQKLQRFFATYETAQGFAGKNEDGEPRLNIPGLDPTDVVAMQSFFQLKSAGNASMTLSQLIFNGSYLVGLQASNTYKELSAKTADQTDQTIIENVTKAFYSVLINKERTQLFNSNINRVDSLLKNTTALHQNGFAESIDVDRVRVALNNLRAERDKFNNLNDLSLQLLKFQMNYAQDQPIEVVGSIQDMQVDANVDSYKEGWDYRNRPDYKVLEVNRRLQELNVKNQYASSMPTLSAFGTLGYSTQSPNISGIFKSTSNINDEGGIGPDKWYSYSQFGLNLSIPIFSGLQRHHKTQQEKLKLMQIENGFINLKAGIDLEIKQSSVNFENAIKSLVAQKENQDLASNIARVTKIKYQQGVGSSLEVTDAENALRTAQTNYYSALFDAMVAKVDLDKAYGKLLPSNDQTKK
jgi:outer membrane protein